MSILDQYPQWRPDISGERKLELFTDRSAAIRHFLSYLYADPPKRRILFFHGDGGNGKSLLLKFLRYYCCKYIPHFDIARIGTLSDEEVKTYFEMAQEQGSIAVAQINF